jgi:hypothetical protein
MQATSTTRRFSIGQTGGVILGIIVAMGLLVALTLVIRDQTQDQPDPAPRAAVTAHIPQNAGEGILGGIVPEAYAGSRTQAAPGLSLYDLQRFYAANGQTLPDSGMLVRPGISAEQMRFLEPNFNLPVDIDDGPPASSQFNHPGTGLDPY